MSQVRIDLLTRVKAASSTWAKPLDYDPIVVDREIRRLVALGKPKEALAYYDTTVNNHGIEGLVTKSYSREWLYSNTGEPYDATLILHPDGYLRVGCWGDIAERNSGLQPFTP